MKKKKNYKFLLGMTLILSPFILILIGIVFGVFLDIILFQLFVCFSLLIMLPAFITGSDLTYK